MLFIYPEPNSFDFFPLLACIFRVWVEPIWPEYSHLGDHHHLSCVVWWSISRQACHRKCCLLCSSSSNHKVCCYGSQSTAVRATRAWSTSYKPLYYPTSSPADGSLSVDRFWANMPTAANLDPNYYFCKISAIKVWAFKDEPVAVLGHKWEEMAWKTRRLAMDSIQCSLILLY